AVVLGGPLAPTPTSYRQPCQPLDPGCNALPANDARHTVVVDSQPRLISNLIVDQTTTHTTGLPAGVTPRGPGNPAAQTAHDNPCGSGGFVCSGPADFEDVGNGLQPAKDPTGSLFIPNITPDFGLSAPFNLMFTFFGQFFDHGLDLVPKSGGTVIMPLKADDPLFN